MYTLRHYIERKKPLPYLVSTILGYLLGCLSPSYMLSKRKDVDLRENGTGNMGATNTMLSMGLRYGVVVMVFDVVKAFLAVRLSQKLFPAKLLVGTLAGCAAIIGHIFPFYLGFRGGKGLAALGGLVLAVDPGAFLPLLIIGVIVSFLINYSCGVPLSASSLFPFFLAHHAQSLSVLVVTGMTSVVLLCKHRDNVRKIKNGTEIKLRPYLKERLGRNNF